MVTGMVALTVLVLIGFAVGAWRFLQDMGKYLEDELDRRLLSVATLTAQVIEAGDFTYDIQSDRARLIVPTLNNILHGIQSRNQMQGVYLVDDSFRVISSSLEVFAPGERLSFLEEDSVFVHRALAGTATAARMQIVAGNRFKSAYAPLRNDLAEIIGVIVVQASADFFALLGPFQRGLIIGGVVSVLLAVLFSVFLFWAVSLLGKTHESLRRSERLAAMGQMAATVAHEIRNPLGIIKGTADVLKSKYGTEETPDELFDYIPSEVRRLNRLVSDFLTFARDRELQCNETDLQKSIEKSLDALQDEVEAASVLLEKDFESVSSVLHDPDAVNQLVLNFTLNAIQAMNGQGKIVVRLRNEMRKRAPFVKVEIVDSGSGFDVDPGKLFEPFYTTKTSGSGLGLAICKRLVEKHGGVIQIESAAGMGTTVRFFLPVTG